jgi:hypothetical protein
MIVRRITALGDAHRSTGTPTTSPRFGIRLANLADDAATCLSGVRSERVDDVDRAPGACTVNTGGADMHGSAVSAG